MAVSQTTGPVLIFQDQAEAATAFDVSRFPNSDILDIARDGPDRLDAAVRSRLQLGRTSLTSYIFTT
jgi:predicted 3-demethylubiquinone-9 3-methyltransferase (glyoxalase superfamily)